MSIEKIRELLRDRNLMAVARGAGVSPSTLYRIIHGSDKIEYKSAVKVMKYLERQSKMLDEKEGE